MARLICGTRNMGNGYGQGMGPQCSGIPCTSAAPVCAGSLLGLLVGVRCPELPVVAGLTEERGRFHALPFSPEIVKHLLFRHRPLLVLCPCLGDYLCALHDFHISTFHAIRCMT